MRPYIRLKSILEASTLIEIKIIKIFPLEYLSPDSALYSMLILTEQFAIVYYDMKRSKCYRQTLAIWLTLTKTKSTWLTIT